MQLSFKTKALLFFCPIIILISIAYTVAAIRVQQGLLRNEIVKRGEVLITIAAKSAELPLLSGNPELVKSAAASISDIENVPFVTFYSPSFELIVHEGMLATNLPPTNISLEEEVVIREQTSYFEFYAPVFSLRAGEDIDMYEESAPNNLHKEHIGWVRVGLSKEVMQETVQSMIKNGAMFAVLLVVLAVALVTVLLNIVLRPLSTLFKAVKNLREGEYPQVPLIAGNDEIGHLSAEFNKMSQAIKDREQRLMYSQKRIRDLFERVEHAIFRLDPDFKVIEGNRRFGELCEQDADFFCLIAEEKRDPLLQAAIAGELVGAEVVITVRGGHNHTISLSVYPEIEEDGSITGFDGHFVDITEKKKMEEALFQTQKLESLGLLAGGIAHDFNNILTSIIGYSEIALMKMAKDAPLRENIEIIFEEGGKAAALTRQLLAFSRKQVMELKVISLNTLINNMANMLGRLLGETIEMKLLLQTSAGNIKADPGKIEQIIMNLSINAKDAMPDGGRLIFETDRIKLDEEYCRTHAGLSAGSYVLLAVTDTGQGLTPEVKENMFDPFFTTKAEGAGTGLGLSTVYGIIKQLKGDVVVYSELGLGTTFKIFFPEVKEAAEADEVVDKVVAKAFMPGTETVLVVDDEGPVRSMVYDTLEPLGYKVIEASSGAAALEIAKMSDSTIDLLLTDVVMPRMGGKELADALETLQPGMKVMFMSGYTDEVIAHLGVLEPGILFINKPLVPSVLTKQIRKIFDD